MYAHTIQCHTIPYNTVAKEAAKTLGYTKKMWNEDKEPESSELDWDELTKKQQKAAKKLGYKQKHWDKEDEEDEE
jgi:Sec-independent protein translocase protein TatA